MVNFSVGMTFVFGGIAVDKPFEIIVWFFATITMLIDLGEEIAADAMDIEGDRQIQYFTKNLHSSFSHHSFTSDTPLLA